MVDHCDSEGCATWFAGWEKTLELAETIPTAQEMPISHLVSFISAPPSEFHSGPRIYGDPARKMSRIDQGSRDKLLNATLASFSSQGEMHSCSKITLI